MEWVAGMLEGGAVVALPTDTVYGLATLPSVPRALAGLFALKRRPPEVAVPVLVGDEDQVGRVAELGPAASRLARLHWPGPLTLVVPRAAGFEADLGGPAGSSATVGVRWPRHRLVESLCRRVGPLAVTSANRHGDPPATTASSVVDLFAGEERLAAVVEGGICDGLPSTVVECRGWHARCLRPGALPWAPAPAAPRGRSAPPAPSGTAIGPAEGGWTDLRRWVPRPRG